MDNGCNYNTKIQKKLRGLVNYKGRLDYKFFFGTKLYKNINEYIFGVN